MHSSDVRIICACCIYLYHVIFSINCVVSTQFYNYWRYCYLEEKVIWSYYTLCWNAMLRIFINQINVQVHNQYNLWLKRYIFKDLLIYDYFMVIEPISFSCPQYFTIWVVYFSAIWITGKKTWSSLKDVNWVWK